MLYATVHAKEYWPLEYEKCQNMHKHLQRMGVVNYQFTVERRMITSPTHPEYKMTLVRWAHDPNTWTNKREVLLETDDTHQMEAALLVLISEAESQVGKSMVLP